MNVVDSTPVVNQTRSIQDHLRQEKLCLLGLLDLAAISVAAKCSPNNWKTLLANRKTHPDTLIAAIEKLTKTEPDITRNPIDAGHILMCAPLTSTASQCQHFLEFCKELDVEPSTATQTLYFFLPFADSHQSSFMGSRHFHQWFPFCASHLGYEKFRLQAPAVATVDYQEGVNSIFRKLDLSAVESLVPASVADRYGLHAPRPVSVGDYMQLQATLFEIVKEIKQQERRTEISKIDKYPQRLAKLESCLVKGTSMKPKHLQKKVNKAAQFLSLMQSNPIDEQVLRSQFVQRYNDAIPVFNIKKQTASYDKLKLSNNFADYNYVPMKISQDMPVNDLEKAVEQIQSVIDVLSKHAVFKSN
jgi:hypothetical protein